MIVTVVIVMVLTVNSDYEIMDLIMATDYDQHDNDGESDSDVVDTDPITAISVPGIPTAVLVPVTGEVLCPVVPSFVKQIMTRPIIFTSSYAQTQSRA